MASENRGTISTEKTVWCGECMHWDQRPYAKNLAKLWKKDGWQYTRKLGWRCPKCAGNGRASKVVVGGFER